MQQTMLALGALLILVTLTLNQQRSVILVQKNAYLREMESAAADFAQMRLHQITEKDFDEARVGMTVLNTNTLDLTPSASFGAETGETSFATFDDIDDFHAFSDTTTHEMNDEEFVIRAEYAVRYVLPDGTPTTTQTLAKEFTVNAETLDGAGFALGRVSFSKIIVISDYD